MLHEYKEKLEREERLETVRVKKSAIMCCFNTYRETGRISWNLLYPKLGAAVDCFLWFPEDWCSAESPARTREMNLIPAANVWVLFDVDEPEAFHMHLFLSVFFKIH
ncbi:hypothetical protein OS493_004608 [Desmophyllum pertusum]|uniref:Uncharacterized protein n=1 Tax=Desmophyllum pertusum TaxID=174260 RepID=A0A9X0D0A6_9CNID|nr:hypothetical protein OS493_004608 [Desmophyllum pertusum]